MAANFPNWRTLATPLPLIERLYRHAEVLRDVIDAPQTIDRSDVVHDSPVPDHAACEIAERSVCPGGSLLAANMARSYSARQVMRSAMACMIRCVRGGTFWSPGATLRQINRLVSGSGFWLPTAANACVTNALRSARWSASALPDHFRETSTRRPGRPNVLRRCARPLQCPATVFEVTPRGWMP